VAELRRQVEDGVPKAVLARGLGVSGETLYQALRPASERAVGGRGPGATNLLVEVSV
jgi:DNA-binding phage protein